MVEEVLHRVGGVMNGTAGGVADLVGGMARRVADLMSRMAGGMPDLMGGMPGFMPHRSGGVFGIGYCVGVAHGLAAGGIPVVGAPSLGTSAGSWAASAVATGVSYDDVAGLEVPSIPSRRGGVLAGRRRRVDQGPLGR